MNHFQQSLDINAKPAAVYAALTTLDGLRSWWTQDCDGNPAAGGTLHFRFGSNAAKDMRVERLAPQQEVRWRCTYADIAVGNLSRRDEWVGTDLIFRLAPQGDGTRLEFEHIGLEPALECYEMCNRGWNYFLKSLRQFAETGYGTPHERVAAAA